MEQYKKLVREIQINGVSKGDRTGIGTKSIFGYQMRFDLEKGFPLVTVKKTHWPSVVHELLWFLKGDTNIKYLNDNGVKIWDEWSNENGDLGPVYGKQWVKWSTQGRGQEENEKINSINQIQNVIDTLKTNPNSRRMIVSAWNVAELPFMALEPCHAFFQFYTTPLTPFDRAEYVKKHNLINDINDHEDEYDNIMDEMDGIGVPTHKLSLQLYQRSCDVALGGPFNIASYSLLLQMMSQCVNMIPGEFIWTIGDAHIYNNHIDGCGEMLRREPLPLPTVKLNPEIKDIFKFTFDDITLINYQSHPKIKLPVAV